MSAKPVLFHQHRKVRLLEMPGKVLNYARPTVRRIKANLSWLHTYLPVAAKSHSLPGLLVVSLTSYPPRFPTVYKTLVRLLHQSVKADRTILWIAPQDMGSLPEKVLALQNKGLEIHPAPETGPYKKIIPALQAFPDAFIVTADDDLDYDVHWLRDCCGTGTVGKTRSSSIAATKSA